MAEEPKIFLSDVHIEYKHNKSEFQRYVTRFEYLIPDETDCSGGACHASVHMDGDGDYEVRRRKSPVNKDCIIIEHSLGTKLTDVGLQVWQASLLLCDFILDNVQLFKGCSCLELGGGVGLASITMAAFANVVICTGNVNCYKL
ncbi:methyltransferase-like protein 22 [Antedon mediterranea]|uniref:methyltransferase-like protein 22 n=1 Tax=Antedon mediterranea TaxID=105859 RepID=UPI003AF9A5FA